MRVVLHVNEVDKWEMTLSNCDALRKEVDVLSMCIVLNGDAVKLAFDKDVDNREVYVCENSLKARGLDSKDMKAGFKTTESAVVMLARLQGDHYAYIKP